METTFRETLLQHLLFIFIYDTLSLINVGQNIEKVKEEEVKEIPENNQVLRDFFLENLFKLDRALVTISTIYKYERMSRHVQRG